jgi:membrane-associated phospholipid phosphatase
MVTRAQAASGGRYAELRRFWDAHGQTATGILMFLLWSLGYFGVGAVTDPETAHHLALPVDRWVPLVPPAVFVYVMIFPLAMLPFALVREKGFFRVMTGAYITLMVICYVFYLTIPVVIDRPAITGDSFAEAMLRFVYSNDPPVNCFPSQHVAMATLAGLTLLEISIPLGLGTLAIAAGIAFSTLLLRQHYIADVVAGALLALAVYFAYYKQRVMEVLGKNIERVQVAVDEAIDRRIDDRVEAIVRQVVREEIDRALDDRRDKAGPDA